MTFGAIESDEEKGNHSRSKSKSIRGELTKNDRY
jgi:hypothetical protein